MRLRVLVIAPVLALTLCGTAEAQESGVFIDPDSPTGKEYALPLAQARDDNSGKRSERAPVTTDASPLFGEGVKPPRQSAPARSKPPAHRRVPARPIPPATINPAATSFDDVPGSRAGSVILPAAAVLLAGGLLGLGARRLLRRRP